MKMELETTEGVMVSIDEYNRLTQAERKLAELTAAQPKEAVASSECPICGNYEPHGHDREQISAWVNGRLSAWGWKANIYNEFTDKPYGWYYYLHHVGYISRFTLSRPDDIHGFIPLYAHPLPVGEVEAQIKHMVNRFLGWRLPENFSPDAGISFKPTFNDHLPMPMKHEPRGTNLFDAQQTEAMVRYMIEGLPHSAILRKHLTQEGYVSVPWRPIETAPTDKPFLATDDDYCEIEKLSGPHKFEDGSIKFFNHNSCNYTRADAWKWWMPLPAAPAASAKDE